MTEYFSRIAGIGAYLPEKVLTNAAMEAIVETSDAWIRERTGISQRHIAADGQYTSDLGVEASRRALDHAGLGPDDIDLIIVATATPDLTFPATATIVQHKLGVRHGCAFDVHAVCSGFIYAMSVADNFIRCGQARTALVIGAETFSRILDWTDRTTCVLFGDGAGAVVLSAEAGAPEDGKGLMKTHLRSDGSFCDLLYVDGGPSRTKTVGHLRMQGNQVFRHAVTKIAGSMTELADMAGVAIADIDWFVPHQANQRILLGVSSRLGIPEERVISTVSMHGNTSAASIPLAFEQAVRDGRIKRGDLVLMEALGGGFTWGAALARY
ncbi:ketoacyl-ACP synthase III [Alkalicaulis satelles]|uniref:Beta-ketoacyl-[acyl-carrier-protein] synthase III n=1 Tax=Alkalicaulis satelles TaxID=2609175 RepID=A0A5M6ZIW8_9PROT|nr:beta-ketoacyl-ACP synthase III [Alkalicaulis satelles]KAA5804729.1 ketoacyl-ACP synthase III [Alkalicaulis satelles]